MTVLTAMCRYITLRHSTGDTAHRRRRIAIGPRPKLQSPRNSNKRQVRLFCSAIEITCRFPSWFSQPRAHRNRAAERFEPRIFSCGHRHSLRGPATKRLNGHSGTPPLLPRLSQDAKLNGRTAQTSGHETRELPSETSLFVRPLTSIHSPRQQ